MGNMAKRCHNALLCIQLIAPKFRHSAQKCQLACQLNETIPTTCTRSLGELSGRMQGGNQVSGYFDIEKPRFALTQGPVWLKIDETTGVLRAHRLFPARWKSSSLS